MAKRWVVVGFLLGTFGLILALAALVTANNAQNRLTDVREEMLVAIHGLRANDLRHISARLEETHTEVGTLQSEFKKLSSVTKEIQTNLGKIDKNISELAKRIKEAETKIHELSQTFQKLAYTSSEIETRFQKITKAVDEFQQALESFRAAFEKGRLKIAVVDAEALFMRVFLPQVARERSLLQAKAQEIQELQAAYGQGQIKADAYQLEYAKLQAEYLQAQVQVNMSMLDKMIASPGFANLHPDLQSLRDQAKPLAEQVEALVRQAQIAILDHLAFFNQLQQFQTTFQEVDKLLTQVAAVKILEISQQVAQEQGYDLVLRTKDVVMYQQVPAISDLTSEVEKRLRNLFL